MRITSRGSWTLRAESPVQPLAGFGPLGNGFASFTAMPPVITIRHLEMTPEQAQSLLSQRRMVSFSVGYHGEILADYLVLTAEETHRIALGEEPLAVLFRGEGRYRLVAVPWQPGDQRW